MIFLEINEINVLALSLVFQPSPKKRDQIQNKLHLEKYEKKNIILLKFNLKKIDYTKKMSIA